jgi:hypothetical protein
MAFNRARFMNEFLGVFVFVTGCNAAGGDHWKMGAALFMALQCFDGTFNPAAQFSGLLDGGDVTNAFLDFGAQVGGAMFAAHFAGMNWGANGGHVSQFMGTFLFFSGLNAAGDSNFNKGIALAVALSCYGGTLNPALTFADNLGGGFNPDSGLFMTIIAQSAGAYAAGKVKDFANA